MSHILLVISLGLFLINCIGIKSKIPKETDNEEMWKKIANYFEPPAEYKNEYGNYRSPL